MVQARLSIGLYCQSSCLYAISAMPRFYCPQPLQPGQLLRLPETVHRHVQVLRLQPQDSLTLFNGEGGEYHATLTQMTNKWSEVLLGAHDPVERESPLQLKLVQGVSSGDRMDYTLQKAVELGVAEIQPVLTRRGIVKLPPERWAKKQAHWQGVVEAACEQCGRNQVPVVHEAQALSAWLAQQHQAGQRGLVLLPGSTQRLREQTAPTGQWLLAGPEGGLSEEEVALALQYGWQALTLGPRVLRTETAALAALAAISALWGDF